MDSLTGPTEPTIGGATGTDYALLGLFAITKSFTGTRALDGVDFDVRAGEIHAVVGENGAGKSTLVNIVSGVHSQYGGRMELHGRPVSLRSPRDAGRHGIRMIHQELTLVPQLTVAENVMLGQEPPGPLGLGVNRKELFTRAARILDDLAFALPLGTPVEQLGTGRQQLVEIARAFAQDMRVLILDEPTAALPQADVERLFDVLRDLRRRGIAIIYISHRLAELPHIADRITVLRDGRVVGTYRADEVDMANISRLMLGRDLSSAFPERTRPEETVVLSVRALRLAGRLHDIAFDLHAGEILGIAGLIGSGRTELLRCLFGAERHEGEVTVSQRSAPLRGPHKAVSLGLALIPEDRRSEGLVLARPAEENLALPFLQRLVRLGLIPRSAVRRHARRLLERLAVEPPLPDLPAAHLSGGNQQKLVVGKWVAVGPRVFLFDEPTRGIDVGTKTAIYGLVDELARGGAGILLVSSELPELVGLCHRILVLREGRLVAEVDGETTSEAELMMLCGGGRAA